MKYIKAKASLVRDNSSIDLNARRTCDGYVMLNDKDLAGVNAETDADKLELIEGVVLSEEDALYELSKNEWL